MTRKGPNNINCPRDCKGEMGKGEGEGEGGVVVCHIILTSDDRQRTELHKPHKMMIIIIIITIIMKIQIEIGK